jgi:tetratricopeptide (TPR) repeat protein
LANDESSTVATADQVISFANTALQQDSNQMEAYDLIGIASARKGDPLSAIKAYEKRLLTSRYDAKAFFRLGEIELRAANVESAKGWYQESLRADAGFIPPRLALAMIYTKHDRDYGLAERHFLDVTGRYRKKATEPELTLAQQELTNILLATRRNKEALEAARSFPVLIALSAQLTITKALAYQASSSSIDPTTFLKEYLAWHAGNFDATVALAQLLEQRGEFDQAIRTYRSAIEAEPTRAEAYLFLIRRFAQSKRFDEALDAANAFITRASLSDHQDIWIPLEERRSPLPYADILAQTRPLANAYRDVAVVPAFVAYLHFKLGSWAQAKKEFQRAARLSKPTDVIWTWLGRTHLRLAEYSSAKQAFEKALSYNFSSARIKYELGLVQLKLRNWKEAESIFKELSSDAVWQDRALDQLGNLAMARGDGSDAVKYWKESLLKNPRLIPPFQSLLRLAGT